MNRFFCHGILLIGTVVCNADESHLRYEGSDESLEVHKATVLLPLTTKEQEVYYELHDSVAVIDGDIEVNLRPAPREPDTQPFQSFDKNGNALGIEPDPDGDGLATTEHEISAINGEQYRWPRGSVPYTIHENVGQALREHIDLAIREMNVTNVKFFPRTNERDYVQFVARTSKELRGAGGRSAVGRQGNRQDISVLQDTEHGGMTTTAPTSTVLHEMGHAIGLYHEHQRTDRDRYVTILEDNIDLQRRKVLFVTIDNPIKTNFGRNVDSVTIGPYDYESPFGYSSFAFSKHDANGNPLPTIVRKDGSLIARRSTLTANDIAGINELYPVSSDTITGDGSVPFLYKGRNFGDSRELRSSARYLGDLNIDRRVSGIRVPDGWTVTLYHKLDFRGHHIEFVGPAEVPDLNKVPMKRDNGKPVFEFVAMNYAQLTWVQARSVHVRGQNANLPPPNNGEVVLYQHSHWRGRRFATDDWHPNLRDKPYQFDNIASSISVPAGRTVELYEHPSYQGRMIRIVGPRDVENLHLAPDGRNWGEVLSSMKILGGAAEARIRERQARLEAAGLQQIEYPEPGKFVP